MMPKTPPKSEQGRLVEWSTDHPSDLEDFDYEETPFGLLLGTPAEWGVTNYNDFEEINYG